MSRTVTQLVALGVLPLGLAMVVYLTARELLLWPLFGARLWGVAVALLLIAIGNELCKRFLAAGDRKRQPHEVGRFLPAYFAPCGGGPRRGGGLHAHRLVLGGGGHSLQPVALLRERRSLAGILGYGIFLWIFFPETDSYRAGRVMLRESGLARAANNHEERDERHLFFAGHWLPFEAATSHFLVMGATNTGKTLIQRMLMQSALKSIGAGLDQRAIVFNAKQDVLSILAGMNLSCPVVTLDPFDARGYAWDMAADITTRTDAETLAANLVPIDEHATQKFFDEAVRSLYEEVIVTFIETAPGDWTLGDVIFTLRDRERLYRVLKQTEEGRELLKLCFANEETAQNIMATVNVRTKPYRSIAGCWQWAKDEGRTVSLTKWLGEESVLVLGNSHKARPAIRAINQVLFTRLAQLILDQDESKTRRNWIFLDEVRQAGRLAALTDLMVEGRSKGACVVLGFQDIEGMKHVHTTHLANELVGQAHNVCVTKLINPETAELVSKMIGEYEAIEKDESVTESQGGGRSRTVSAKRSEAPGRDAVRDHEHADAKPQDRPDVLRTHAARSVPGDDPGQGGGLDLDGCQHRPRTGRDGRPGAGTGRAAGSFGRGARRTTGG